MLIIQKIFNKLCKTCIKRKLSTSLSDNQVYPQICLRASNDYRYFNNFRRNSAYNEILEHVSQKQGLKYLELLKNDQEILKEINKFKENDKYGNPKVFDYAPFGKISPTTLRYIKVLSDLKKYMRTLNDLSICEIGVGYGGQCRIINAYFKPSTYHLIDIKPALMLAQRYLDNFILHSTAIYKTMNELSNNHYDLVISNYAFTELPRSIQDVYLKKVILNSQRGYITYNEITPDFFKSYKKDELLKIIPNVQLIAEVPLTNPGNCIMIWGDVQ